MFEANCTHNLVEVGVPSAKFINLLWLMPRTARIAARRNNSKKKVEDLNKLLPARSYKFVFAHDVTQKIKGQSMLECAQCNVAVSSNHRHKCRRRVGRAFLLRSKFTGWRRAARGTTWGRWSRPKSMRSVLDPRPRGPGKAHSAVDIGQCCAESGAATRALGSLLRPCEAPAHQTAP